MTPRARILRVVTAIACVAFGAFCVLRVVYRMPDGMWIAEPIADNKPVESEVSDPEFLGRFSWMPGTYGSRDDFVGVLRKVDRLDRIVVRIPVVRRVIPLDVELRRTDRREEIAGRRFCWFTASRID